MKPRAEKDYWSKTPTSIRRHKLPPGFKRLASPRENSEHRRLGSRFDVRRDWELNSSRCRRD